jgi:hypothetical protein
MGVASVNHSVDRSETGAVFTLCDNYVTAL